MERWNLIFSQNAETYLTYFHESWEAEILVGYSIRRELKNATNFMLKIEKMAKLSQFDFQLGVTYRQNWTADCVQKSFRCMNSQSYNRFFFEL